MTGIPTKYTDNYTFELWDYNYNNYTSDKIRFYLDSDYLRDFEANKLDILIFNQGKLQKLNN